MICAVGQQKPNLIPIYIAVYDDFNKGPLVGYAISVTNYLNNTCKIYFNGIFLRAYWIDWPS